MGLYLGAWILALLTIPVMLFAKRRFEECLPVVAIAAMEFLFLGGVFGALRFSVYALAGLALLLCIFAVCRLRRVESERAVFFENALTPGFFLFLAVTVIMPILCGKLQLYSWDEFSHWGLAAKDMFLSNAMPYRSGSHVTMRSIPPFVTLFQYFFLRLGGSYSEPVIYAAQNLLCVILLLPMARRIERRNWQGIVPLALLISCLPLVFFPNYWFSAYVDTLLGLALAYSIGSYFADEQKGIFALISASLGISLLIMMKNLGLEYAVIPMALILFDYLFVWRKAESLRRVSSGRRVACAVMCLLLMLGARGVFELALLANGKASSEVTLLLRLFGGAVSGGTETASAAVAAGTDATASAVENALGGFLKAYQIEGISTFLQFWRLDNTDRFGIFTLSYWSLYVLFSGFGLLLLWLLRGEKDFKSLRVCVGGLILGFWVYALLTLIGCIFVFPARQARVLLSFDRYMRSCYLAMLAVLLLLLFRRIAKKHLLLALTVAACLFVMNASPGEIVFRIGGRSAEYSVPIPAVHVETELGALDAETDRVAFVSQGDSGFHKLCVSYHAMPLQVQQCVAWNFVPEDGQRDDIRMFIEPETWLGTLNAQGFTHVYLYRTDDYFNEAFACLFEDPTAMEHETLFELRSDSALLRRCE